MKRLILAAAACLCATAVYAQDPATGFPPFGSFQQFGLDSVNRQNLNVNLSLPIVAVPQRGGTFSFSIVYDSLIWKKVDTNWVRVVDNNGNPTWGWKKDFPNGKVSFHKSTAQIKCYPPGEPWYWGIRTTWSGYAYADAAGTQHAFPIGPIVEACDYPTSGTVTGTASDTSGFYIDATNHDNPKVRGPSGSQLLYNDVFTDTSGNFITKTVNQDITTWTDATGHTALVLDKSNWPAGNGTYYYDYKYVNNSNQQQTIRLYFDQNPRNIHTNFGCQNPTIQEFTGTDRLPTSLVIMAAEQGQPDQTYAFDYEETPNYSGPDPPYYTGRLKKITLPMGGYIEFTYPGSNNGINCADGTVLNMTRTVSDGTNSYAWTFSRTQVTDWITTVTAPQLTYDTASNVSKFRFSMSGQIVKEEHFQGSSAIRRTIETTWAGNGTPSSTKIALEDNNKQSKTDTTFDSYGNLTQSTEYDWGDGAPGSAVRTTQLVYLGGTNYISRNIVNRPRQIRVRSGGVGGAIKSQTDIAYDQSGYINTPCESTNPVQHDGTNFGCDFPYRGLPTTVTTYDNAAAPSGPLARHSFYDQMGNLRKADLNCCQQKEWSYTPVTEFSFPTSEISGPSGTQLTTSASYNGYTGLRLSTTDENNVVTTFAYDGLKRLTSVTRTKDSEAL